MRKQALIAVMGTAAAAFTLSPIGASASSHREAPLISQDPVADNTDVYAFTDPVDSTKVDLIANWIPVEVPSGGPNFYAFGDDVLYQIHIDNVGDAKDHIVYSFQFTTKTVDPTTFLYTAGPVSYDDSTKTYKNWNRPQTYSMALWRNGDNRQIATGLLTPPDAVGKNSTGDAANYHTLAMAAINDVGNGVKVFAGQRDDPFFVNLGGIFSPLNVTGAATGAVDTLNGVNVHSIAIQVPKATVKGPNDSVIGVWATSKRATTTVLNANGSKAPGSGGKGHFWTQVSRLGNPLVNEVVVPLGGKDLFNATTPADDKQFLTGVTSPLLAKYLNAFFKVNAPETNRTDLVAVFLTGIKGVNMPTNPNQVPGDELRLNMDTPVTHANPNDVNRLGALAKEADGFPNGRRLGDDVTDIELQAVDGATCAFGTPACTPGAMATTLGDGVAKDADAILQTQFPYVADPHSPAS
ncbi:MAG TPA: DUF4331 domain-containing protein [Candidatus Dormibacteraeota bacterium]